jgi:Domain of unknown function (DUF4345)
MAFHSIALLSLVKARKAFQNHTGEKTMRPSVRWLVLLAGLFLIVAALVRPSITELIFLAGVVAVLIAIVWLIPPIIVTALVFLIGLFMIFIAVSVLFQPATTAPSLLGIVPDNAHALSTLRGDVQGFFSIIGITMLWGAWKRSGDLLLVPAIIMLLVVAGRVVSVAQDGMYEGFAMAVGVEVAIAALLLWARALLPHHAITDVGD